MEVLTAFYGFVYELLALTFCISGIAGHCFSIVLLSRMLNPTNLLLISMSCSQLTLSVNFLFSTMFKFGSEEMCLPFLSSQLWAYVFLISVNLSVIVHMVGVFHVVALSIVRYLSLQKLSTMNSNSVWFDYPKCIRSIVIIYSSVTLLCLPIYFHSKVAESNEPDENCVKKYPSLANSTVYHLSFSDNEELHKINFWWFGIVCKIAPCILLFIMTILILRELKIIRQMSERFSNAKKDAQHHRTTNIILIVMVVFILVEAPQGFLNIIQTVVMVPYQDTIWDFFELCTLITSCVIFALFLTMNSRLREAFVEVVSKNLLKLRPKCCCKKSSSDSDKDRLFETSSTETCRLTHSEISRVPNYGNTGF